MAKKIVKKRKIKFLNLLLVLLVITGLSFVVYFSLQIPVKNIIIKNTSYLNDDMILELAEIKDYPPFITTNTKKVERKLEKSPYISNAKLRKKCAKQKENDAEAAVSAKEMIAGHDEKRLTLTLTKKCR